MAGDQGKLKEICALKGKYEFRLLVDDAHGFGNTPVKPALELVKNKVARMRSIFYFSTFAKKHGQYRRLHGWPRRVIIDYIRYNIRSQIFCKELTNADRAWQP